MTLYVPPTNSQARRMIARRILLGRPAIMAICIMGFASSVVTSSHSNFGPSNAALATIGGDDVVPEIARTLHMPQAAVTLPTATPLAAPSALADSDRLETLPFIDDPDAMIREAIREAHPKFEARPLPDIALDTDTLFGSGDVPGARLPQPEASVRLASLTPPEAGGHFAGEHIFPRMPDTASLTIIPPELSTQGHRDSSARIDTGSGTRVIGDTYRIETVRALGGETLADLLDGFHVNDDDKRATLVALRADSISETLSADDRLDLAFKPNRKLGTNKLIGVRLRFHAPVEGDERIVELLWDSDKPDLWAAVSADEETQEAAFRPVTTSEALGGHFLGMNEPERVFVQGIVNSSLYEAADTAGMTPGEATTLTDIFRYLVDFERDLRVGDRFEVLFDKKENGDYGDIVYAMIENQGRQTALFRAETEPGIFEYFDREGKTNKRALMRTPLAYARISSNFGMRRHPIDGYRKMHRGVDFRAPTGTPIVAAGNGVIDYLGRRGGYGKYIRIRHTGTYKTAYAHMSRYAQGLRSGMSVKQGDVIGYVGSTGRSTGPHLHFEVIENGKRINPMQIGDFGPIHSLSGPELARFKAGIAKISLVLAELRPKAVVATVAQ
mgnify:CR=1 FL=1